MNHPAPETPTLTPEHFYTVKEVAAIFRVSVSTIHAWRVDGHFPPAIRLGRRSVRWSGQTLIDHVSEHTIGAAAA